VCWDVYVLTDSAGTAQMGSTVDFSAHNSGEAHGVAASPGPSSPAQSSQSSGSSGKVLLLEALLSFLHSAVGSVCIIGFHIHEYDVYTYVQEEELSHSTDHISCICVASCCSKQSSH
jgi:hypothetical protein